MLVLVAAYSIITFVMDSTAMKSIGLIIVGISYMVSISYIFWFSANNIEDIYSVLVCAITFILLSAPIIYFMLRLNGLFSKWTEETRSQVAMFILSFSIFVSSIITILPVASYLAPFNTQTESCVQLQSESKWKHLDLPWSTYVYINDVANYFRFFKNIKKESYNGHYRNICSNFLKLKHNIKIEYSDIDFVDHYVHEILFNIAYIDDYFRIKDIGINEYNEIKSKLNLELSEALSIKKYD